jgi:hypothetical protein
MKTFTGSNICLKCCKKIKHEWRKDKKAINTPLRFCSRSCSNSRGARTEEFKKKVKEKLLGYKQSEKTKQKCIESLRKRGITPTCDKPNLLCNFCQKDTGSPYLKTCCKDCLVNWNKITSTINPKCGGQKHTHRSKISNIKGEIFVAESSYEVTLSNILNNLKILWIRPSFFGTKIIKTNKEDITQIFIYLCIMYILIQKMIS